jgi:hypothetical protein
VRHDPDAGAVGRSFGCGGRRAWHDGTGRAERGSGRRAAVRHPGAWCRVRRPERSMPCLRQQAFQLARRSLWPARTFASHPQKWSKRRRGRASLKNNTPQGAGSGAATPAHAAAQGGRSGRRTQGRHDRRATQGALAGEDATTVDDTAKGAAGGRSDVAKCNEPPSAGRKTSDRGPNHPRTSGGAACASKRGTSESRRRAAAVACSQTGWPSVLRQPFDRRPSRTRRYLILVPRPCFRLFFGIYSTKQKSFDSRVFRLFN